MCWWSRDEAREIPRALAQRLAGALERGAEQAREHRDQQHRAGVHRPDREHRAGAARRCPSGAAGSQPVSAASSTRPWAKTAKRRRRERAPPFEEQGAVDRDQHEQEGKHGIDAAREPDQPAHDRDVGRDVDRGEALAWLRTRGSTSP